MKELLSGVTGRLFSSEIYGATYSAGTGDHVLTVLGLVVMALPMGWGVGLPGSSVTVFVLSAKSSCVCISCVDEGTG